MRSNDLGASLPYGSLPLFLEMMHDRAQAKWATKKLETATRQVLHDVQLMNKFPSTSCRWTASDEEEDKTALVDLLDALRELFRELQQYLADRAEAVQLQHGGVQPHDSINDLMQKIASVVDKTALMTLEEQVFSIHGAQNANVLVRAAEYAAEGVRLIDAALGGKQSGSK